VIINDIPGFAIYKFVVFIGNGSHGGVFCFYKTPVR